MDIDLIKFPRKIQMSHACILQILSKMAVIEVNRNESLHAYKDPQRPQKGYNKINHIII